MSFLADLRALFRPDRDDAPPVMDGPLTPNRLLDDASPIGDALPGCDDLAIASDGSALVTAGPELVRLSGAAWSERTVVARFAQDAGPIALAAAGPSAGDGPVYVGLSGGGVVRVEQGQVTATLAGVDGRPLRCATAIVLLPGGRVAIAEGSSAHLPADWCVDLMQRRAQGRIVIASADLASATTLLDCLAWPYGLALAPDGVSLWFSESWRHRIQWIPLDGGGPPRTVIRNLPGYPARLSPDPRGGYWLSVFAARTHLVDFVLREDAFREAMLKSVDPRYWIAPSLMATGHYLEPLQGGSIKKLGLVKPWAPPRSYGLVVKVSSEGDVIGGLHSRVGGHHHGITAARAVGDRLLVVSKGAGRVLVRAIGDAP